MKKVHIIGGICVGAILVVTVSYFIFGQPNSPQQTTLFESVDEDTREDRPPSKDISESRSNSVLLTKSKEEDVIKPEVEEEKNVCSPCPSVEPKFLPPPVVEPKPDPPEVKKEVQPDQPTPKEDESGKPKWAMSSTTQLTFSGDAVREFPRDELKFRAFSSESVTRHKVDPWCEKWAVMTTIFEVSDAVRRQVKLRNWCLVVVFDKRSAKTYDTGWMVGEGNDAVVFLRPDDQVAMSNVFVDALPWNHFGRKNIGYLYAIMHGAKVIWDFDDDNALTFWIPGAAPPGAPSIDDAVPKNDEQTIEVLEPKDHNWPTYNPYPILGSPTLPSWPRGLPLDDIKVANCSDTPLHSIRIKGGSIAVLQSLAEYQPDVDAIFRLTMPIPFFFNKTKVDKHLMIPKGTLTPYNAQATLHFSAGFFGLFLPITVSGRVTDIWRSFIAQRLFWDTGLQFGFIARPLVVQDRNVHSNIGDLGSEWDLYVKGKPLMEFLESWEGKGRTMVERTEELWVALYERKYVEYHDIELVQLWLQTLIDVGYKFPDIVEKSYSSATYPAPPSGSTNTEEEHCSNTQHFKFWNSDRHDGSRIDMPSVLATLGHKVVLAGKKQNKSSYSYVFNRPGITVYNNLSDVIRRNDKPPRLTETMIKENFEYYKANPEIASTDIFMCSYPPSMCEIWMPFNKTLAIIPAHRYNLGRCSTKEWTRLTEHLKMLATMDNPKHVIGASSVYDQEYLRYYTGLDPLPLYSLTTMYTDNNPYNPTKDEILCVSRMGDAITATLLAEVTKYTIVDIYKHYSRYELSDLVAHRAIVYFPYASMSYKLSEFYGLGIPLFMPSPRFLRSIHNLGDDRSMLSRCSGNQDAVKNMKPDPRSTHPYNPNIDGGEDEYYWLQFSDFYQWPHITYFDDMRDLEQKLGKADFQNIHKLMIEEVERKKASVLNTWCKALKGVESGRKVPQDYNTAIQQLYGVPRLQVN